MYVTSFYFPFGVTFWVLACSLPLLISSMFFIFLYPMVFLHCSPSYLINKCSYFWNLFLISIQKCFLISYFVRLLMLNIQLALVLPWHPLLVFTTYFFYHDLVYLVFTLPFRDVHVKLWISLSLENLIIITQHEFYGRVTTRLALPSDRRHQFMNPCFRFRIDQT